MAEMSILWQKLVAEETGEKSSAAETEDKPTLLHFPLDLDSTFAHKPDQIELQLDRS